MMSVFDVVDFVDALANLERWSTPDPWTSTSYQLLKMSEDYRRFSRRNMNIFNFIFVVIFTYEWNILLQCPDTSFSVREILPRYAWKRTRTLTTLEGSPVDAAMIRLRPDADQRIVTLDRGWSPVLPSQPREYCCAWIEKQTIAPLRRGSKFITRY